MNDLQKNPYLFGFRIIEQDVLPKRKSCFMIYKGGRVPFTTKSRKIYYGMIIKLWFWYGGVKIWFN